MAKFKPRKTGKHAKGHGKPKKPYPVSKPVSRPPVSSAMRKALDFKPTTELGYIVKFGMMMEAAGYDVFNSDYYGGED